MRAMYFSIDRHIFPKAGHALNLCFNKTKMEVCSFRRRAFTDFLPVSLNGSLIEFSDFANGKMNSPNAFCIRLVCFEKRFRQNGLDCLEFAHVGFTARLI